MEIKHYLEAQIAVKELRAKRQAASNLEVNFPFPVEIIPVNFDYSYHFIFPPFQTVYFFPFFNYYNQGYGNMLQLQYQDDPIDQEQQQTEENKLAEETKKKASDLQITMAEF